jgi:hypothetical protein
MQNCKDLSDIRPQMHLHICHSLVSYSHSTAKDFGHLNQGRVAQGKQEIHVKFCFKHLMEINHQSVFYCMFGLLYGLGCAGSLSPQHGAVHGSCKESEQGAVLQLVWLGMGLTNTNHKKNKPVAKIRNRPLPLTHSWVNNLSYRIWMRFGMRNIRSLYKVGSQMMCGTSHM